VTADLAERPHRRLNDSKLEPNRRKRLRDHGPSVAGGASRTSILDVTVKVTGTESVHRPRVEGPRRHSDQVPAGTPFGGRELIRRGVERAH